ncbi:MAG: HigA family addiction module antitoxin [Thermoanaerobaculia bacterium]
MSTPAPRPFRPVKPGELLQEELDERGWTQADFAAILGRPLQAVNEIIGGKKAITAETAVALSKALGTSAEYWLHLDSLYRLDLLHARSPVAEEDIARRAKVFTAVPVKELLKRRWLTVANPKDSRQLERAVCDFLQVKTLDQRPDLLLAARRGRPEDPQNASLVAWVCHARALARRQKVGPYRQAAARPAAAMLPRLSAEEGGVAQVRERLAQLGIRFVIAAPLPSTRVDGAAFWLDAKSPVIALSLRYDRVDWFWFTLLHELAHIVSGHAKGETRIDDALVGRDRDESPAARGSDEAAADALASEWLLPHEKLHAFVEATKPYFSRQSVVDFAASLGVHPGVVVGRLQHDGLVPWTYFRSHLGPVRFQIDDSPPASGSRRPR